MVIGFAGKAAAGKTTAALFLKGVLKDETRIIPMAEALRGEVAAFLRQSGAEAAVPLVYGSQEDKVRVFHVDSARALAACAQWGGFVAAHHDLQDCQGLTAVTVRRLLQWWGTEYRRAQAPDYWTTAWSTLVAPYDLTRTHVLVDDIRFMNEVAVVRAHGGLLVKIDRPGCLGANSHSSETALDDFVDWDAVIVNGGTLAEFAAAIERLPLRLPIS